MVDRESRTQMCAAIRAYMAETITAFALDDALESLAQKSLDKTLGFVRKLMWFHYDDRKDHKIVASKEEWNYFNRILLLLESEAEGDFVRVHSSRRDEWCYFFHHKQSSPYEIAVAPFASVSGLLAIRRSVTSFVRTRYPKQVAGRRIRDPFVEGAMKVPGILMMLFIYPIFLLIQLVRPSHLEPRVTLPHQKKLEVVG